MRNIVTSLTTGVALLGLGMLANAASPGEQQPEARAYVNFTFGGSSGASESFFYGLRLDHDSRYTAEARPPMMSVEFDREGFSSARLNGLPFSRSLRLNQDGIEETQWTWIDWGLLAAGVVGLGFVVAEVADSEDESRDPPPGTTSGGKTTGGTTGGDTPGDGLGGLLGGLGGGGFRAEYGENAMDAVERQRLLDDGTGNMGDLIADR